MKKKIECKGCKCNVWGIVRNHKRYCPRCFEKLKQGRKEVLEEFDKTFGFSSWKESDGLTFHDKIWIRNMKIKWEGVLASIEAEKDLIEPKPLTRHGKGLQSPSETSKCECGHLKIRHHKKDGSGFCMEFIGEVTCDCPKFREAKK